MNWPKNPHPYDRLRGPARDEHAWLLRAEGLKPLEIAVRLGITPERVRQMVRKFGRAVQRSMRRERVKQLFKSGPS